MNTALSLLDSAAIRLRIQKVHAQMQQRAKPKKWKSGKRAGSVRKPGLDRLPFTSADLLAWMMDELGPTGVVQCPYCIATGRPAAILDAGNGVIDHIVPVARGGEYVLGNFRYVCADCNRLKGSMSHEFFLALLPFIESAPAGDREYVYACLRTHGQVHQYRRDLRGKKGGADTPALPQAALPLTENF